MNPYLLALGAMTSLMLFRHDLRVEDNPALVAAAQAGPIAAAFIYDEQQDPEWNYGGASKWWLHHSLKALCSRLQADYGLDLIIIKDKNFSRAVVKLCRDLGVNSLYLNRRYEPKIFKEDQALRAELLRHDVEVFISPSYLLREPFEVHKEDGSFYKVFTPFMKVHRTLLPLAPTLKAPKKVTVLKTVVKSCSVEDLQLLPEIPWDKAFYENWAPGELGAQRNLKTFVKNSLAHYAEGRNLPGAAGTSRLSPHLHFGELSPRQVWEAVENSSAPAQAQYVYLNELIWRDFAHHILFHFPHTDAQPMRPEFKSFPWVQSKKLLRAWQRGQTGYPIVDAGMRELWTTGWMHNRVRMIVASFLVKHLRLSWQAGAEWFWDTLVDASLAQNSFNWQWSAGSGADAAPYFRIFNPVTQAEKFDAQGEYIRRWVPELAKLPDDLVHAPWLAKPELLEKINFRLGRDYPHPVVDHATARTEALNAFKSLRSS